MNRRIFGHALGGITAITLMKKQTILTHAIFPSEGWESTPSAVAGSSWPTEVAGVRVKTNAIISLAIQELRNSSSAVLVNHATRTFYFGALIGRANKNNFDPEILFIAVKRGFRVDEVPVSWAHDERTRMSYLKDGMKMLEEIAIIRWNAFMGRYNKKIEHIHRAPQAR